VTAAGSPLTKIASLYSQHWKDEQVPNPGSDKQKEKRLKKGEKTKRREKEDCQLLRTIKDSKKNGIEKRKSLRGGA